MFYENGIEMVHEDFGRGWAVRFIGTKGELDVSRWGFANTTGNYSSPEWRRPEGHVQKSR